jgi:guanine deaminase
MTLARTLRGRVLCPDPDAPGWTELADGLVELDAAGRIVAVGPAPAGCAVPETWPGAVLLPGFVDAHLHYPQFRMTGSASGPLLTWLSTTTFPEEARFRDGAYADAVAAELCGALARAGTTMCSLYGSPHPEATDRLFRALDRAGLRAQAGMTLMDRDAPAENLLGPGPALAACREHIARWHGHDDDRLRVVLTPRFAISCTPEMLRGVGALAAELGVPLQTHISENDDEIAYTASLFPDSADYLGVYEDHGCLQPGTLLGHCIHLSDSEWARLVAAGAVAVHCPDSNFFLGSGVMGLGAALDRGARVALGSDIGGGRAVSMRRVAARAYDASLLAGQRVDPGTLLWLATRGGARAMGAGDLVGCVAPGFEADLVAVDLPPGGVGDLFDQLLFREDHGPVRATLVRGRTVWAAPA